ncbi:MAG: MSHA biogenesis protein MshK [Betaproteobacteria bacterium HGW-Betaproteobacteria-6]|jgi:MSHA biogenesis protein MshK|nr:MAG: MSHA biogenesis protein MshK [Betaproteobacteria bacterium HGW-Betaproteobacteria-6]
MRPIVLALLAITSSALAQSADPTRPPAAWLAPADVAAGSGDDASGGLRLQSVLMPHGGRPVAVIGGQTVPLGGRIGGATLVRLSEREAVLKGADGVTRLYLTPDVEKHMIETPNSRRNGKSGPVKGLP